MEKLLTIEGVTAVILIIGGTIVTLKRYGFIQFGKKASTPPAAPLACPDPECKDAIQGSISGLRNDFKEFKKDVHPKINDTAEAVARIEGYIAGKKNGSGG